MASYIDNGYLSAVQGVQFPDYLTAYSRGYQLGNAMPWSAEQMRKRQLEDYAIAQKQQAFAAAQAQQAQQLKLREMIAGAQIAKLNRTNSDQQTAFNPVNFYAALEKLKRPQGPPSNIPPLQGTGPNLERTTVENYDTPIGM